MDKKGAEHQWVFISFILAVLGFIVILLFWNRADLLGQTDEQLCRASVEARSITGPVKEIVPLNCKTKYLCLSKDGSCEQLSAKKEIIKVRDADDVYNALAENMQDCWWQFGEGKVNYVGEGLQEKLYCSICSQIGIDDSIDFFPNNEIDKKELYKYLATKGSGVTEGMKEKSILEYLTGVDKSADIEKALLESNSSFGSIKVGKQHYVVMGAVKKINKEALWALAGGGLIAGVAISVVTAGGGSFVLPLIVGSIAGAGGGYFIGTTVEGEQGNKFVSPTIIEADSEDFAKLECALINTLA